MTQAPVTRSHFITGNAKIPVDGAEIITINATGDASITLGDGSIFGQEVAVRFTSVKATGQSSAPKLNVAGERGIYSNGFLMPNMESYAERTYGNGTTAYPAGDIYDPYEYLLILKWAGKHWMVENGFGFFTAFPA